MNAEINKNDYSSLSSKLLGQFSPEPLGVRLFMEREEISKAENVLVWFHERYHYLQTIFTPYGQLKWGGIPLGRSGCYRSLDGFVKSQ